MLTQFELSSAQRIARVVRAVEQEPRRAKPLGFDPIAFGSGKKVFRVCTFTGAWTKNTAKTITLRNHTTTPNTVSATNLFAEIPAPPSARNCAIARDGTAWYLIAAEC